MTLMREDLMDPLVSLNSITTHKVSSTPEFVRYYTLASVGTGIETDYNLVVYNTRTILVQYWYKVLVLKNILVSGKYHPKQY